MNNSMHRRTFIRNTSLAASAALAFPSLASAAKVFGKVERQKVKHVVYCILGGGVRMNETIGHENGRLMPNLLHGENIVRPELGFEILPPVLANPLSESATLYTNFSYSAGALSHYSAMAAALCGKYFEHPLDYRDALTDNSLFDFYSSSRTLAGKENKAVWIPNALSNYKSFAGKENGCYVHPYHSETLQQRNERAASFFVELNRMRINEDLRCIAAAAESVQNHQPELLVFNLQGADSCHSNYTAYCENLHLTDYGIARLWEVIQNTPGMANDTVLIVAPEHGRDQHPNSISDQNGLFGFDHASENDARKTFCLVAGTAEVVTQNRTITEKTESIDILPTIAHLLGFENILPTLPGKILHEAFAQAV
jgi:hypothetical protein